MTQMQDEWRSKRRLPLDIPLGRVEFMGQVLHIIERDGSLFAAGTNEEGRVMAVLGERALSARGCRN